MDPIGIGFRRVPSVPCTKSHKLFFFIPEIVVFLKTCQLSKMFFSETTFLLVKAFWGFEKHQLRGSFLNLQTCVMNFDQVSNFDFSTKNWKIRKFLPPPNRDYLGGVQFNWTIFNYLPYFCYRIQLKNFLKKSFKHFKTLIL